MPPFGERFVGVGFGSIVLVELKQRLSPERVFPSQRIIAVFREFADWILWTVVADRRGDKFRIFDLMNGNAADPNRDRERAHDILEDLPLATEHEMDLSQKLALNLTRVPKGPSPRGGKSNRLSHKGTSTISAECVYVLGGVTVSARRTPRLCIVFPVDLPLQELFLGVEHMPPQISRTLRTAFQFRSIFGPSL